MLRKVRYSKPLIGLYHANINNYYFTHIQPIVPSILFLISPFSRLSQPQQESSGHTKDLHKREALIAQWNFAHLQTRMKPHVTIEDRLNHLKVKESWD